MRICSFKAINSWYAGVLTSSFGNPLLPAVVTLSVVVLLLITCVALLLLALALTATKLNKWRAEKGHTDTPHYYNQIGGGIWQTTERICGEVGEGIGPSEGPSGPYQELELGTMEERHYESLNKDTIAEV